MTHHKKCWTSTVLQSFGMCFVNVATSTSILFYFPQGLTDANWNNREHFRRWNDLSLGEYTVGRALRAAENQDEEMSSNMRNKQHQQILWIGPNESHCLTPLLVDDIVINTFNQLFHVIPYDSNILGIISIQMSPVNPTEVLSSRARRSATAQKLQNMAAKLI